MATPVPATLGEFKKHLNKQDDAAVDDLELQTMLVAATETVEGWAPEGREAVGPIVARSFTDRVRAESGLLILPRTPVQSVTSVTRVSDGFVYQLASLDVDTTSGVVELKSGRIDSGRYEVVYTAGHDPVPHALKLATLIIGKHMWDTQRGPKTRLRGEDPELTAQWAGAGYLVPNQAAHLMQPYTSVAVG